MGNASRKTIGKLIGKPVINIVNNFGIFKPYIFLKKLILYNQAISQRRFIQSCWCFRWRLEELNPFCWPAKLIEIMLATLRASSTRKWFALCLHMPLFTKRLSSIGICIPLCATQNPVVLIFFILRMRLVSVPVDPVTYKVDMKAMKRAINRNTCMVHYIRNYYFN